MTQREALGIVLERLSHVMGFSGDPQLDAAEKVVRKMLSERSTPEERDNIVGTGRFADGNQVTGNTETGTDWNDIGCCPIDAGPQIGDHSGAPDLHVTTLKDAADSLEKRLEARKKPK